MVFLEKRLPHDLDPQLQTIHLSELKGLIGVPVSAEKQEGIAP
ncbi:hypothetical protein [Peribacillus butanolivorans]